MELIDQVSINALSKKDLLLILKALEYTNENTGLEDFIDLRNNIVNGYEVPASSVRIEEMINYFHYDYDDPKKGEKFAVYTEYADCPWNEDTKLVLISLNTEDIDFTEAPDSNIVFLIDVVAIGWNHE